MRRLLPVLAGLLALPAPSHAGAPAPAGRTARIDAVMARWARPDSPGCAVAIVQKGEVVHEQGYGMADLERGVAIGPETVFDIGSTSKQFTAAAVWLLVAEGRLSLGDDVRQHLPELPSLAESPVTLAHLLHHTGGLRDYIDLLLLGGAHLDGVTDARDALDSLARQKALEFPPGTRHAYSNSGYFLLAQVVERVTGKPFAAFVAERLFAPLGMTRSHVHDDHTLIVPGRAIGYAPRQGGGWRIEMSGWEQTGDGAVMTTVRDLARWDANFYDPRVGGQALLDGLHRKGSLSSGEEIDYASGLVHGVHRGLATVSHAGEWAGYRAQLLRFPAQRTSLIVLCNTNEADPSGVAYAIAEVVLEDELAPAPAAGGAAAPLVLSPAELDLWAGSYRETGSGALMRVAREGDALVIGAGGQRLQLLPTGRSSFVLGSPPDQVALAFEGSAPARRIRVSGEGVSESYAEARPPAPDAAELSALAGRYRSSELAAEWTLSLEAGRLIARAGALEGELEPSAADEFALQPLGVVVAFHRDEEAVTGFELRGRRLGGIHFERLTAK